MRAGVFAAFFAVLCVHCATAKCPDGSIKSLEAGSCFKVYSAALSWIDAEFRCQAEKGHLASIASADNERFLQKATSKVALSNYWLGGARDLQDGAWYWSDGSSWNYTSWATGHPIDGSVCLSFNAITMEWCAEDCRKTMSYICQITPICSSAPPKLPTAPPAPRCAHGWQYLEASDLCYAFLEHKRHEYSWDEARTLCSEAGGGLASIPNRAVNDAIVSLANSRLVYKCGYLLLAYPSFGKWSNFACNQSSMAAICERAPFDTAPGGALPPPNLPAPPTTPRCDYGWHYLEASNLCYAVKEYKGIKSTNTSYWNDVKTACSDAGGGLVSIPSKAINDAILVIATDAKAKQDWVYLVIGASYNNATSKWEWTDGSEMRYTNRKVGEPHSSDSDLYGYMRITPEHIGSWINMNGVLERASYALICERAPFDA